MAFTDTIGEFRITVEVDDSAAFDGFEQKFEQTANKVEGRASTLSDKVQGFLEKGFLATGIVKNLTDTFSSGAEAVESRAQQLSTTIQDNFAKIAGGIAGGFAFDQAVAQFDQLETRTSEVLTLLDNQSEFAFGRLSADVLDFQQELGIATDQAVPALYQAISAGQTDDPFGFLEIARDAAIGGLADLDVAVSALSGTVNAYADEAVTAERVSDVLFTGVKLGVTTFGELASELPKVTSTAAALGIEIEDVTAGVSALTLAGIDTARASTFLNQAFVELARSGTEADKSFRSFSEGVSFQDFIADGNNLADAIELIAQGAEQTDTSILDMFGSVEAGRAVLTLTRNNGEQLRSTLDAMGSSFGATARASETLSRTSEQTRARISALIQTAQQTFGARVAPFINEFLLLLEDLLPVLIRTADTLGGTFALAFQIALPGIRAAVAVLELVLGIVESLPAPLLTAALAYRALSSAKLTIVTAGANVIKSFASQTAAGQALGAGLRSAADTAKTSFAGIGGSAAGAAKALTAIRLALPLIGIAVVAAATAWNVYQKAQEEAAKQADAYAEAVSGDIVETTTALAQETVSLANSMELLSGVTGSVNFDGVSESGQGLLAIIEDSDRVFNGFNASLQGLFGKIPGVRRFADAFDGTIFEDGFEELDANEALDGLSDKLGRLGADFDKLGSAGERNGAFFEDLANDFQRTGSLATEFGRLAALSASDLAKLGDAGTLGPAIAELDRLASTGRISQAELSALTASLADLGAAADSTRQSAEQFAGDTLARLNSQGSELVRTLVRDAEAMALLSGSSTPAISALGNVRDRLKEIADRDSDGIVDGTNIALSDLETAALEAGLSVEEVDEAFADLKGTLTDVDDLLDQITSAYREQFGIAKSVAEATADMEEAYDDLREGLQDLTAADTADDLEKLADVQKDLQSATGEQAETLREQAAALEETIEAEEEAARVRRDAIRDWDLSNEAAREAQELAIGYSEAALELAEANLTSGESIGSVVEALQAQEDALAESLIQFGVAESAALEYVNALDITPESLQTLVELVGADTSIADIAGLISQMDNVPQSVKTEVALLGKDATLNDVLAILAKVDDLDGKDATVDVDVKGADAAKRELDSVSASADDADGKDVALDVAVTGDIAALAAMDGLIAAADDVEASDATVEFGVAGDIAALAAMDGLIASAGDVEASDPSVDTTTTGTDEAVQDMNEVIVKADEVDATDPTVEMGVDGDIAALAAMDGLIAKAAEVEGSDPTITVTIEQSGVLDGFVPGGPGSLAALNNFVGANAGGNVNRTENTVNIAAQSVDEQVLARLISLELGDLVT